ncbi:hypothetical protein ACV35O_34680, partial [Pseudomonas aeruginosa]
LEALDQADTVVLPQVEVADDQADPNIGLVICDLYLGQDNGIRLIESLKEVAGNGRFFESIILTGHDGRQEVIEAMLV